MINKFISALFFILITNVIQANITMEWLARHNSAVHDYEEARGLKLLPSGDIIITGYNNKMVAVKYTKSGYQVWQYEYPEFDCGARAMTYDRQGNIYLAGDGFNGDKYVVVKLDSAGNQLWESSYETQWAIPAGIVVDSSGNIYVAGSLGFNNIAAIKYAPGGSVIWMKVFNNNQKAVTMQSVFIDPNSNLYLTATKDTTNDRDFLFIKYDSSGNLLFTKFISVSSSDTLSSSCMDENSNFYFTGESQYKFQTARLNSSGDVLWIKEFGGTNLFSSSGRAICTDKNFNVYVSGLSEDSVTGDFNITTLKYNSTGDFQWSAMYTGQGVDYDVPYSINADADGNIYVTGYTTVSPGNKDFIILMYDTTGVLRWQSSYNGTGGGSDISCFVVSDNEGNFYISGNSPGKSTTSDIVTIKYSRFSGIQNASDVYPYTFKLYQNYPNPFNPTTKIKFDISPSPLERAGVRLIIYDLLGREVATLVNETLKPGTYEVEWDGSIFASGVYLYSLITSEFTETKKLILLK
jgi:type IX secretion system substrate protein/beta-propeller repeat-containing protein